MNDHPSLNTDEQVLADALHRDLHRDLRHDIITMPDLHRVEAVSRRRGTRLRHRRQGAVGLATLVVVGLGVGGLAATHGGQGGGPVSTTGGFAAAPVGTSSSGAAPTAGISSLNRIGGSGPSGRVGGSGSGKGDALRPIETGTPQTPTSPPRLDLTQAYAVLDDDGWTAPDGNVIADEKLYYTQDDGPGAMSLNWRTDDLGTDATPEQRRAALDAHYGSGPDAGSTTIDGDPADVFGSGRAFTVVGPVRDGRFLTLSVTGVSLTEVQALAPEVHRQRVR